MTYMQSASGEVFQTTNPERHKDCTKLTKQAGALARRDYCRAELRKLLKPGSIVYTILRSVSASGISRRISVCAVIDGEIRNLDWLAADATGWNVSAKGEGLSVTGCGMDMGFHVVYELGAAMWPDGTPEAHGHRNGQPDTSGGYALRHSWL